MAKQDRFYFENFLSSADASCSAAAFLADFLKHYDHTKIADALTDLHKIEHAGDEKKHEMSAALARAFVTPVDREDLALISQNIDDVTDKLEEVLQHFYMDGITEVLPEAITFADKLVDCCGLMRNMLTELENFKKPARLHELIVELSHAEEECDILYLQAVMAIRSHTDDVLTVIYWRQIYEAMESCADACEHVGDSIDTIVMKNS